MEQEYEMLHAAIGIKFNCQMQEQVHYISCPVFLDSEE